MSAQVVITHEAQRAKIGRILHRAMRRRGIPVSGDARLHAGHWCVRMCGAFKRVTKCLIAHTTGEVRTYDQSRPRITRRSA